MLSELANDTFDDVPFVKVMEKLELPVCTDVVEMPCVGGGLMTGLVTRMSPAAGAAPEPASPLDPLAPLESPLESGSVDSLSGRSVRSEEELVTVNSFDHD